MSTGSGAVQCLQCGWEEANEEFNGHDCSHRLMCRRCGYYESEIPEFDENQHFRGSTCTPKTGAGALGYRLKGPFWHCFRALHTSADVTRAQDWLRDKLKVGAVEDTAYVTRWSFETEQVETILGKFYLSLEEINNLAERNRQRSSGDEERNESA